MLQNPFADNARVMERISEAKSIGMRYVVVCPCAYVGNELTFTVFTFTHRIDAWKKADYIAKYGTWCYILNIEDELNGVVAYLSGYCNHK